MSYAQRKELSGNRTLAWVFTIVVVGSLLYAIVTGLAYSVIKKGVENLKVVDVEDKPPPPPDKPPPPPKDMPKVPPPPMTPPPLVRTEAPPPPIQTVTQVAPPVIPPVAPSPPQPPPPPHKAQSAQSAKGSLVSLFSTDDYPASAIAAEAQGTARATITIGPDGRVVSCNITQSTGNSALDAATCNVIRRRAKYVPARDSNGNAISDTIDTPPIKWVLPAE